MEITGIGNGKNYPIIIGNNIIDNIINYFSSSKKALVLFDNNVNKMYIERIKSLGFNTFVYYTYGEKSKTIECYLEIMNILIINHFSRNDLIISIGGGATTDLGGFVAGSYKRGLNLINIPSTTLSMIDAAIGGKNAIDFNGVKNVIGSFYDPSLVIVDFDLLKTLDENTFNQGLVEAIKCGLICDEELFEMFLKDDFHDNLLEIIARSIKIKNDIVKKDYFDHNERKVLNFGHTFAHALESYSNYKISHGEAVAFGMMQVIDKKYLSKLEKALNSLKINYEFDVARSDLIEYIKNDKKSDDSYIDLVLLERIGKAKIIKTKISELV